MIKQLQESYSLSGACRAFGVHRSSFNYWLTYSSKEKAVCPKLAAEIQRAFNLSDGSAGARSIAQMVTEAGMELSRYRASKAMKQLNLKSKQPPKYKNKNSGKEHYVAGNLLNREFDVAAPNTVWCTDVTYLWTSDGWSYLAVVLDLYSRRPVGWAVSKHPDTALTVKALDTAFEARGRPRNLMLHSDQGCHFVSKNYRNRLKRYGIQHSMSRRGNCWDNAPMERFFRSLKTEWMPKAGWQDMKEVKHAVNDYILRYYNRYRPHQHNQGMTPMQKEMAYKKL